MRSGGLQDLVGPQVVGVRGGRCQGVPSPLVGAVEVLPGLPRLVRLLAAPAGVDEVLVGALQGTEQLEPLEPGGLLDGAGPATEALLEAVLLVARDRDGVDLHDTHEAPLPAWGDAQSPGCGTLGT